MSTKREKARLLLFDRYSQNLALVYPGLRGKYVCPLCLNHEFTEESVRGKDPLLNLEHCIPDGLGQVKYVLACKRCNSTTGHQIDVHIHRRTHFADFWEGNSLPVQANLEIDGNLMSVNVCRTTSDSEPNRMDIEVIEKASSSEAIRRSQEAIGSGSSFSGFRLNFGPKVVPDHRRSQISLLKTAYLLAFRQFGYSYILHQELDRIRQQITNPAKDELALRALVLRAPADTLPSSIVIVTWPESLHAYLVPIPLKKSSYLVALPTNSKTLSNWDSNYDVAKCDAGLQLRFDLLPEPNLLDPDQLVWWTGRHTEPSDLEMQ